MTERHIDDKEITGILFDIQRFSINDGPGIRTNLFFKGCPLRCLWCHNPESYQAGRQMSFLKNACVGCMACVAACPNQANRTIKEDGRVRLYMDYQRCSACGRCLAVCCYDARAMIGKEYTVKQLTEAVMTDREYYQIGKEEQGGITLTGGEPMLQFEFIKMFLDQLPGIHVCMETSGYAPSWKFLALLDQVDVFLFDYKVTDSGLHQKLCGVENQLILENLEILCRKNKDVILRLPLIAGVNDDEQHLQAIADLINRHPNILYGEIMAYHNLGISKAEQIGMQGKVLEQKNTEQEQKETWLRYFHKCGLTRIRLG